AIGGAAARVRVPPPPALLPPLTSRLRLLPGGARAAPARLQAMRATIAWSHDLLTADEQALFRRVSVFAGDFTLEAAEAVCGQATGDRQQTTGEVTTVDRRLSLVASVLDLLASLVDQSLLRQTGELHGDPCFAMLETIREYGLEQLTTAGEEAEVRRRHAAYFVALAERAETALTGPDQAGWLDRLERDHANLQAALAWAIETGKVDSALRLGGSLWRFWSLRGHLGEGPGWLRRARGSAGGPPPPARGRR